MGDSTAQGIAKVRYAEGRRPSVFCCSSWCSHCPLASEFEYNATPGPILTIARTNPTDKLNFITSPPSIQQRGMYPALVRYQIFMVTPSAILPKTRPDVSDVVVADAEPVEDANES